MSPRRASLALAFVALAALAVGAEVRPRGFLGLSTATSAAVPAMPAGETRTFPSALDIVFVVPGGPGEAAGLREGDAVLALDGAGFDPKDGDPALAWRQRIVAMTPGDEVTLTVLRRGVVTRATKDGADVADPEAFVGGLAAAIAQLAPGASVTVDARRVERVEDLKLVVGRHPLDPPPGLLTVTCSLGPASEPEPWAALARELTSRTGTTAAWTAQQESLRAVATSDDPTRLDLARAGLVDPPRWPATAARAAASLTERAAGGAPLPVLRAAARALDVTRPEGRSGSEATPEDVAARTPMPAVGSAQELAGAVAERLRLASLVRERALAAIPPEDRAFLAQHAAELPAALAETIYLHADENRGRAATNRRLLDLARRADVGGLLHAASIVQWLLDPAWLESVARTLASQPGAGAEIVLRVPTPQGEIVIGGMGRNTYRDAEPAVIIDLGGDDLYANGAGTAMGDARPVSIVVDLAGDDRYEGTDAFVQGCGVLGVGLLLDAAGDDRYLGKDGAQGAAVVGVGMVIDRAGRDRYRALHFAQGAGFFGLGAVIDDEGNDAYEALSQAQGLGLPRGVGLVHDVVGDDRYFAKGGAKTGYGTQGVFDGWSQGCGLGLRYLASGGLGLLADDAGEDEYEAGNFSQGGGYFFGFGMLRDGGASDDRYLGSRYGQGWSAHQALGAFLEEGGDDAYETTHGVIAGLAWDQSVTWFCDRSGDDTYRGSFFSLGASAHNGVTLFEDGDGSDSYSGVEIARSGPNDYHGGTSLTIFLDLGRGRDAYEKGAPGALQANGAHGFALDLPGSLADAAGPGGAGALLDGGAREARRATGRLGR